jgi:phospholipase/carboxylesterase
MSGFDLRPRHAGLDPHGQARMLRRGPPAGAAPLGLVLLHGRGDSAAGISTLVDELEARFAGPLSVVAPDAVGGQWYPHRFLEPVERNEPWLGSALAAVGRAVAELEAGGLMRKQIVVAGFSQGACLALEYVAREGGAWGAVVGLSGGLIGADVDPARYPLRLDGTVVFLGCSDVDPHIPEDRVHASGRQLLSQGASVTTRIYPGMAHTVNADEIAWFAQHLNALTLAAAT